MDDATFDIYKNGLTSTINQADSDFATGIAKQFCPRSVSEMSSFVAIIRPGCASLRQDFIDRKDYTTGVKELDDILVEGNHRMIYQELIMKYLIWLGIPETGSYDIIKKIAKKKFKEAELEDLKAKLLEGWRAHVHTDEGFIETWTVVEQAAHYSFNASHSLAYAYDSLYGAYLKSHYPLEYYMTALNYYEKDSARTLNLTKELSSFGIVLKPIKFRHSIGGYSLSREDRSIYKGIASIKDMNATVAEELYELRNNEYASFVDLLYDIKNKTSLNSKQTRILIELDFFDEFGDTNNLLEQYRIFDKFYGRSQLKKDSLDDLGIPLDSVKKYSTKETDKMLTGIDSRRLITDLAMQVKKQPRNLSQRISAQIDYLGYVTISDPGYDKLAVVLSVDTKYSPRVKMYSLKNGTTVDCKIDRRTFSRCELKEKDIVRITGVTQKPKVKKNDDGEWEPIPGLKELWITNYRVLNFLNY